MLSLGFGCSLRLVCGIFDKSQGWYFYRPRYRSKVTRIERPELMEAVRTVVNSRPATYGYRRVHAMVKRLSIACDPKTVNRYMALKLWLSNERQKRQTRQRREGIVAVAEPDKRWASDITIIKAWNSERGRLSIVIDCGSRQVIECLWARSIKGDDIGRMVQRAVRKRFENGAIPVNGSVEFLSDNGPEYIKTELRLLLRQMGFTVCNTPIRSPESNGIAESFFKSFKRDYVYQNVCESFEDIAVKIGGWIEDYNTKAPHSALGMLTPAQFYEDWKLKSRLQVVQK